MLARKLCYCRPGAMTTPPDDSPKIDLSHVFEGISKVKLCGGVVGRVCWVLIFSIVAIALIGASAVAFPAGAFIAAIAIVAIVLLVFTFLNRLINFARKNPEAALLEGAEFIKLEQLRFGMKSFPLLPPPKPTESVAAREITTPPQDAALPDQKVSSSTQLPNG